VSRQECLHHFPPVSRQRILLRNRQ
jgi:hypothetical protein